MEEINALALKYQDFFGGRKIYTYAFICYEFNIRPRSFKGLFFSKSDRRKFYRGLDACRHGRDPGTQGNAPLLSVWRLYEFIKKIEEMEKKGIKISVSESVVVVCVKI